MPLLSVDELAGDRDAAWPGLVERINQAFVPVRMHPALPEDGRQTLYRLQVTTRSTLGALALNCGALEVDHGWVKVLGAGAAGLPDLAFANGLGEPTAESRPPALLVVALDVLGGVFAINGGGLGFAPGEVCYWAPDTLNWDSTGMAHSSFMHALLAGAFSGFYADLRWEGWEAEVQSLPTDHGLFVYPPLASEQGRDVSRCSRKSVPFAELATMR